MSRRLRKDSPAGRESDDLSLQKLAVILPHQQSHMRILD